MRLIMKGNLFFERRNIRLNLESTLIIYREEDCPLKSYFINGASALAKTHG